MQRWFDWFFMREALRQAVRAQASQEVPIGAVVVSAGKVLGTGFNRTISAIDSTAHAEVVALRDAATRSGNYRLVGSVMYVTVEPCLMCLGALLNARVSTLVFGCREPKMGALSKYGIRLASGTLEIIEGVCAEEAEQLLKTFFVARRGA